MEIIRLNETGSTNTYAKKLLAENKITQSTCIITSSQTNGKGMHSNVWKTDANKNLTFSIICFPNFLHPSRQFQLNKAVSLSVIDLIKKFLPNDNMSVKWPNDIYIGTKKVGGILIETSVIGQKMNWVVVGIGINVNQQKFAEDLPQAASLFHFSKVDFKLDRLLDSYICFFHQRYAQLSANKLDEIDRAYLQSLFRLGKPSKFVYKEKEMIATITGVNEYGWLQLITVDKKKLECEMKEISFVI